MKQKRIIEKAPVLDSNGQPYVGWSPKEILEYDRDAIKAPFYRIKEWDWYQISNDDIAVQFTYGHASYAGQVGVMMFDFTKGEMIYVKDKIMVLPFSGMNLPESTTANSKISYNEKSNLKKNEISLVLEKIDHERKIKCRTTDFEAEFVLTETTPHSLVINIPFDESKTAFYYNQKISAMSAKGHVKVNGREYVFEKDSWGLLDWGRGVWPFHNEWFWSSASGRLNGEIFGVNLGCGFGNTSEATENCIFYGNEIHKLGHVKFDLGESYDDPWHLYDEEGRLDLIMTPTYDRETKIKLLWVDNNTHQMFGSFNGKAVLDDGTELKVDGIKGFAEHAVNNW